MTEQKFGPLFEANASPEAIAAHLRTLRSKRRTLDNTIQRLEDLLVARSAEKASGVWPPASEEV